MCQDCAVPAAFGLMQSSVSDVFKIEHILALSVQYHVSFILSSLPNELQLAVASHTSDFWFVTGSSLN